MIVCVVVLREWFTYIAVATTILQLIEYFFHGRACETCNK